MPNPSTVIRLDPAIRRRLDEYRHRTRRSLNASIEVLVVQALDHEDTTGPEQLQLDAAAEERNELRRLEGRLRRAADRQGMELHKSRQRDPLGLDYGRWRLTRDGDEVITTRELAPIAWYLGQEAA